MDCINLLFKLLAHKKQQLKTQISLDKCKEDLSFKKKRIKKELCSFGTLLPLVMEKFSKQRVTRRGTKKLSPPSGLLWTSVSSTNWDYVTI